MKSLFKRPLWHLSSTRERSRESRGERARPSARRSRPRATPSTAEIHLTWSRTETSWRRMKSRRCVEDHRLITKTGSSDARAIARPTAFAADAWVGHVGVRSHFTFVS